jgi:hypothetical protein
MSMRIPELLSMRPREIRTKLRKISTTNNKLSKIVIHPPLTAEHFKMS